MIRPAVTNPESLAKKAERTVNTLACLDVLILLASMS